MSRTCSRSVVLVESWEMQMNVAGWKHCYSTMSVTRGDEGLISV